MRNKKKMHFFSLMGENKELNVSSKFAFLKKKKLSKKNVTTEKTIPHECTEHWLRGGVFFFCFCFYIGGGGVKKQAHRREKKEEKW